VGWSRRRFLEVGGIGLLGLGLPRLLRAEARARATGLTPKADACILIFLNGGPSHLDMWDLKPDAPAEVRGEFQPIPSSLPGVTVCEHLPRLSRLTHLGTLIRSAHHSVNNAHAAAVYCALTGHDRGERGGGAAPTDNPAIGSVLGGCRPPRQPIVPYVSMPHITAEGAGGPPQPGFFAGWLGRAHDPFFMLQDPSAADFALPELAPPPGVGPERQRQRQRLLGEVGAAPAALATDRHLLDMDTFQAQAFDLLDAPATRKAFRLDLEDPKLRDAYGRNIYGQCALLARRLIEAGTRAACLSWAPDANATWDTHGGNFAKLKGTLLPQLDAAVGTLLMDLQQRGLLERTLVAVMGEFGRTPKINNNQGGRDHWNFCYSLMLFGGGIQAGLVHGASDRLGAYPARDPVTPAQIVSTLYHCLGIPHDLELHDQLGRPLTVVPQGRVLHEILA
jgi:hypothetical protein